MSLILCTEYMLNGLLRDVFTVPVFWLGQYQSLTTCILIGPVLNLIPVIHYLYFVQFIFQLSSGSSRVCISIKHFFGSDQPLRTVWLSLYVMTVISHILVTLFKYVLGLQNNM